MPDLEDPAAPGTRMQPKFFLTSAKLPLGTPDADRRETLAKWLTAQRMVRQGAVNRMWAELVGEGFYEPIDDLGPDRTAPAPEDDRSCWPQGFRDSGYDMKWLIETICATDAYQRAVAAAARRGEDDVPFAANVPQPLRADQLYNAVLSALDMPERRRTPPAAAAAGAASAASNRGPRTQFNQTFGYDPSEPREAISRLDPASAGDDELAASRRRPAAPTAAS